MGKRNKDDASVGFPDRNTCHGQDRPLVDVAFSEQFVSESEMAGKRESERRPRCKQVY